MPLLPGVVFVPNGYMIHIFYRFWVALGHGSRKSNRLSLHLRKKIEGFNILQVIGVNLAGFTFFSAIIVPQADDIASSLEVTLATQETVIEISAADTYFQWPLSRFGLTSRFSLGHPGIDLTAPLGTPLFPIAQGVVAWTQSQPWGYGNHLLVEHERGIKSLYAHLSKIAVSPGQEVSKATSLGTIGATGWATGYHLHLEIYQDGVPINPLEVLPQLP